MENGPDRDRLESIVEEILQTARCQLLMNFRFLDMALFQLRSTLHPVLDWGTDGISLFYTAEHVLKRYQLGEQKHTGEVGHDILHTLMHCVFRHMFIPAAIDRRLWNVCCDVAAEAQIHGLGERVPSSHVDKQIDSALAKLKEQVPLMTADSLYAYFHDPDHSADPILALEQLFNRDTHELWYLPRDGGSNGNGDGDSDDSRNGDGSDDPLQSYLDSMTPEEIEQAMKDWEHISQRMQVDITAFSQKHGKEAGSMLQALEHLHRERYDYSSFLRRFATRHEVMRISDSEFDLNFYTFGLETYGDTPLIEPLEYRDDKRINELVIAIDTSGSTSGELVQTFIQKTYNILKAEETFRRRFNLWIIQCDAEIQDAAYITCQAEFDDYIKHLKLRGFGGTSFVPVFDYVDEMIREHQFRHLKGLIYFTDGYGTFPAKKPQYDAAFVFAETRTDTAEDLRKVPLPPWAIRIVLNKDEIENI